MIIQENIPLAPFTTMKVGGPARYFVEVKSENQAREALQFALQKNLPVFILGGGSNIVVSDEGFSGLVIKNEIKGFNVENLGNNVVRVTAGGGENWDEFVKRVVEMGLAGAENLSGVPGSVGAAPVQNIGAYGVSVDKLIVEVRYLDTKTLELKSISGNKCEFGYRDSIFKRRPGKYFITGVVFEFISGGSVNISAYSDLREYFTNWPKTPTLEEVRRAIIEIRSRKGMVVMPEYESFRSVGSFFKNPVVTREKFESLKIDCPGVWFWEQNDARVKISAACLVEQCGFLKGYREGNVGISPKHSLAIINLGGASARSIKSFAIKIKNAVKNKFGIELEEEAQFIGF